MGEKRMMKGLMKLLLCVIVVLSLMVIPAFAASGEETDNALTVGVPVDRCPVFYINSDTDEITGIGVDLMRLAANDAGYNVTFKPIEEK
jgi:hypothetical protein